MRREDNNSNEKVIKRKEPVEVIETLPEEALIQEEPKSKKLTKKKNLF